MKDSLLAKLARLEERHEEVCALLVSEQATRDLTQFRRLHQELAELQEVVRHFSAWRAARDDHDTALQLSVDPDLKAFAREESEHAQQRMQAEASTLERLLLPRDPDDRRNVLLEIRAGTGGEESALFAAELLRMYLRFAERQGWQCEMLSSSPSDLGGIREAIVRIAGPSVYSVLKFESGGHRVQRVPQTESQGRIHTSACTVAVLPEPDEADAVSLSTVDAKEGSDGASRPEPPRRRSTISRR